jgi:predicted metal-dependent phosphoesterase TrpH/glycosyltransferase involved in cell wall biosynthesis
VPAQRFAIAQFTPYPWEQGHEVNRYVRRLSEELAGRGHRVAIVAPSSSRTLIRAGRDRVRALRDDPGAILDGAPGEPTVIGVGQSLPFRRGGSVALPLDVSRTLEDLLERVELDFVHVHEPFAPSAASAALRHSRALNVGTFHSAAERFVSTQVARPLVDRLFGRLDGRTAAFGATRELVERFFPGGYEVVRPGADLLERAEEPGAAPELLFTAGEERGALRLFLRALRRLPEELAWTATVWHPDPGTAPAPQLSRRLRERVRFVGPAVGGEAEHLARATAVVATSAGTAPAPGILLRALAAGAVPVAARLGQYEEVLEEGELGPLFEPRDTLTLAAQLERLVADPALVEKYRERAASVRPRLGWDRTAAEFEAIYERVAARRHEPAGNGAVRKRLVEREYIHVDVHMHTDHSPDCATPVTSLLDAAEAAGLGAIAITDHNEVSGAHEARAQAQRDGRKLQVIVAEEVKTADQGEVIGLFIEDKIPRGMTLRETIDAIRAQGGLVYVPHPFDRMHSVPDYEHLLDVVEDVDAIEVFNPRVAFSAFNEEAERFAAKYRIVAGAGSDSHVAAGLGSVKIRMRAFDGPEEFLESLREADIVRKRTSLLYVQALKFIQTKATPGGARRRTARPGAGAKRAAGGSSKGRSG